MNYEDISEIEIGSATKAKLEKRLKEVKECYPKATDSFRETIAMYREFHTLHSHLGYNFEKLEPFLDVFDDIPAKNKLKELVLFTVYIRLLCEIKKSPKRQKLYQKYNKQLKAIDTTLEVLEFLKEENKTIANDVDTAQKALTRIASRFRDKDRKPFFKNKQNIKLLLQNINKKYNLNQSLGMKQLLDNI